MKKILFLLFIIINSSFLWGQTGVTSQEKLNNKYLLKVIDYNHNIRREDDLCEKYVIFKIVNSSNVTKEISFIDSKSNDYFYKGLINIYIQEDFKNLVIYAYAHEARDRVVGSDTCNGGSKSEFSYKFPIFSSSSYVKLAPASS